MRVFSDYKEEILRVRRKNPRILFFLIKICYTESHFEESGGSLLSLGEIFTPVVLAKIWNVLFAILMFVVGRKLIHIALRELDKAAERIKMEAGLRKFLRALSQIVCYGLLIYMIADTVGIPTASFVALLGSLGVTIGLALQGSLSNFASGVLLLVLHPFHVGDAISGGGVEGVVDTIGLFYTTVNGYNNQQFNVPNSNLTSTAITNYSALPQRRIELFVGISYEDDPAKARRVLTEMLQKREKVIRPEDTVVFVDDLGDSAVRLGLRCWVKNADYWSERWAINEEIKSTLEANGISIPYNQLDVHVTDRA